MIRVIHAAFRNALRDVATVDTDDLEVAYHLTNTINAPWYKPTDPAVTVIPDLAPDGGLRSTSMDDFMVRDGEVYIVDFVGFEKVTDDGKYFITLVEGRDYTEVTGAALKELVLF